MASIVLLAAGCSGDRTVGKSESSMPTTRESTTRTADEASLGGLRFTDATALAGLATPQSTQARQSFEAMTAGAAVGDYDNDGDFDVYLTRTGATNLLYRNEGDGTFSDVTTDAGVQGTDLEGGHSAPAFADVNGDGFLDLFMTGASRPANTLYVNDGTGRFRDETGARGLQLDLSVSVVSSIQMHGSSFADINHDGALDLLALHWDTDVLGEIGDEMLIAQIKSKERSGTTSLPCIAAEVVRRRGFKRSPTAQPNMSRFYLNDGSGHFRSAGDEFGLKLDEIVAFTGSFADVDGDGWEDLAVTGDGCTSRFYRNEKGVRFEDVTTSSGVGADENGMGSVLADLDVDGDLDWFVTGIGYPTRSGSCPADVIAVGCSGNRLYENEGSGEFADATDRLGLRNAWWGWGAAIESFTGSRRPQIVVANGFHERLEGRSGSNLRYFKSFTDDPMRFWIDVDGHFEDAARLVGLDDSDGASPENGSRAVVPFDYDGDGDLDLLITRAQDTPRLFRNDRPGGMGWTTVRLFQAGVGNRFAEGARVELIARDGEEPLVGWITSNGSFDSQRPPEVHFGLGKSPPQVIHEIRVYWPILTGQSEPTVLRGQPTNKVLLIVGRRGR